MKRLRLPAAITILASCTLLAGCLTRGSGNERRESREAGAFDEIEVGGIFDVNVRVGPAASIEVIGDDNIVPLVETSISGDRLHIDTSESISPKLDLIVNVTTPNLAALRTSGSCEVDVSGVTGTSFEIDSSGVADITVAGTVDSFELDLSGAGRVGAFALKAQEVKIDMSGAGKADVHAERSLVAKVSGAGSVRYAGDPTEVEERVSGVGKVKPH